MRIAWLVAGLCLASAAASVVPVKGERKAADATFLKRQRLVLDLFSGLGHDELFQNEHANFDILANSGQFTDPTVAKKFMEAFHRGMLPKDEIFTMSCKHVRYQTILLFDVFYFAKDWDTFYKAACFARAHMNPIQFSYAYSLALAHREDCRGFLIPPPYEVFPNYFVPQDTMHKIYDFKMAGNKQGRFEYNNTGYEYLYHDNMFGGPLALDIFNPHNEYKVSYFREDVGLNTLYAYATPYPSWMCPMKYNLKGFFRTGEKFYYFHQQLLARYTLERLANALPFVEPFYYDRPIRVGYNPRIAHFNGQSFIARPDSYSFDYAMNKQAINQAEVYEERLIDAIDYGSIWNQTSDTLTSITNDDGIDMIGKFFTGSVVHHDNNGKYFGSYYHNLLDALGYMAKTKNMIDYNGGVTTSQLTALRDPAYYNMLVRMIGVFQRLKANLHPYTKKEMMFPGVSVTNFEVDKLITYFDMFDYEVTNGVAVKDPKEYLDIKYHASQFRLNHKPYNFKITANSDAAYDGMVRVFIGPKYDSEEHELTLNQKRMAMVEIDRFPVKIAAGQNVWERSSKDSNFFMPEIESFRSIYERVDHSIKTNEPFYIKERVTCGYPERLQLPRGWKSGQPFTFFVIVTPYKQEGAGHEAETVCGSNKLYDHKPAGFPFDRPIWESEFKVPNVFFKDELIFHKDEVEVNRAN
ncbi:hypothetical protein GE061_010862 [Apolygus lucorum]|uniref:Uncharacterized protein n=1 Tax=Apolygus lucorum TaxID=248454 RepID=A0A6A4K120_APOLU|nr:hypothetical protein GE061_010862 [Apolygus lucorum]